MEREEEQVYHMKKNYPDVSGLFAQKEEWRRRMNERPIAEKLLVVARLKHLSKEIPKLAKTNTRSVAAKPSTPETEIASSLIAARNDTGHAVIASSEAILA